MTPTHDQLTPAHRAGLAAFQRAHGVRVRRAKAMELLNIASEETFQKVVDAQPTLKHRLPGEGQDKYVTAIIYFMLPEASRCATCGEGTENSKSQTPIPKYL